MIERSGTWLMYLRKSRQDDPNETVEQVLAKHENILQEWCQREIGSQIPEKNIYREIVSGESIDARHEIKAVLARIEDPAVAGVVCMEPSRLSRGDLADCSRIIDSFRFSRSLVATPYMVYDLENKMERKFFKDELLRGNDFLEYTKEILFRGRVAAVKRGCYIGNTPPYGYNKVKIGKDHTLEINEAEAAAVRLVFKWYTQEQLTPLRIADRLNEMGVKPARIDKWKKDTIRVMLRNPHYAGYVAFNQKKETQVLENGRIVTKTLAQPEKDIIIAEGKHTGIISRDEWKAAQALVARNPRIDPSKELVNPLAGLLVCKKCGNRMIHHPYKHAADRIECRTRPRCYKSAKREDIVADLLVILEKEHLPQLLARIKNGDGDARKIQQRLLAKLEKQMEDYRAQEERQYDLLETNPNYPQEVFERRNKALREKMDECQAAIYKTKSALPQSVDYAERVAALRHAIRLLRDDTATPEAQNKALKMVIDHIDYSAQESDPTNRQRNGVDFDLTVYMRL